MLQGAEEEGAEGAALRTARTGTRSARRGNARAAGRASSSGGGRRSEQGAIGAVGGGIAAAREVAARAVFKVFKGALVSPFAAPLFALLATGGPAASGGGRLVRMGVRRGEERRGVHARVVVVVVLGKRYLLGGMLRRAPKTIPGGPGGNRGSTVGSRVGGLECVWGGGGMERRGGS